MVKVVGIAGPTASGKTRLSIELAGILDGEIVSADSMAVYKDMDIGTAKPDKEEKNRAVFHMVDLLEPENEYNVGRFQEDSHTVIDNIISRGKTAIVCGGSGLYMKAACEGLGAKMPECSLTLRNSIERIYERKGLGFLKEYLKKIDPEITASLDMENPRRLKRAVEIYKSVGVPPSSLLKDEDLPKRPEHLIFALTMPREILIERINSRIDIMIEKGLIEEVRGLKDRLSITAGQAIGYKEILLYLNNECTKEEAIERLKISTRQFAKRQYTWFRKDENIVWIDIFEKNTDEIIDEIINKSRNY